MLRHIKDIPIQQRDVRFPLRSNSSVGAVPVRLDLDGDGRNDATRWLVSNCSWDPQGSAPAVLRLLVRDDDLSVGEGGYPAWKNRPRLRSNGGAPRP